MSSLFFICHFHPAESGRNIGRNIQPDATACIAQQRRIHHPAQTHAQAPRFRPASHRSSHTAPRSTAPGTPPAGSTPARAPAQTAQTAPHKTRLSSRKRTFRTSHTSPATASGKRQQRVLQLVGKVAVRPPHTHVPRMDKVLHLERDEAVRQPARSGSAPPPSPVTPQPRTKASASAANAAAEGSATSTQQQDSPPETQCCTSTPPQPDAEPHAPASCFSPSRPQQARRKQPAQSSSSGTSRTCCTAAPTRTPRPAETSPATASTCAARRAAKLPRNQPRQHYAERIDQRRRQPKHLPARFRTTQSPPGRRTPSAADKPQTPTFRCRASLRNCSSS